MATGGSQTPYQPFPRYALVGAGCLIAVAILAAIVGRLIGPENAGVPGEVLVASREVRFEDRADGAVVVREADGTVLEVLAPGTNGFARSVLRGFARERMRRDVGQEPPFRLARWDDGRVTLEDPSTGRRAELNAFGSSNVAVFAQMLTIGHGTP